MKGAAGARGRLATGKRVPRLAQRADETVPIIGRTTKGGVKLFVIDSLQVLHSTSRRAENRQQEIADISNGIKALAKELKASTIVLSRLNRESEKDTTASRGCRTCANPARLNRIPIWWLYSTNQPAVKTTLSGSQASNRLPCRWIS